MKRLKPGLLLLTIAPCFLWAQPAVHPSAQLSYKDLKFPPLRKVTLPKVTSATLSNGMKLFLLEDHELPLISGFALVRTGNLFEPSDKVGLAELTGTVLRTGGTEASTGDQLDEQLENMAATVESSIGQTSGQVSFSALRDSSDEVLRIFRDILISPAFRQEKLDLAKSQIRSAISRRNDDPEHIAEREFESILYGRDTPYGRRVEYEHLDHISRDDLVAFYKRYFFPANIMLAVYGDFSTPEMQAKLERLFGSWNYRQPPVPPFPEVRDQPSRGVYLAVKDDVTQTFFRLGQLGGVLRDRNYPALEVMSDILGGGFRSRLFRKVRTELAYAYYINASWSADYDHRGVFEIRGSTKSRSTTETLEAILREVERICTTEVSDEELQAAKDSVLNSFVFHFDTPGKTLYRMVTYEYYGYPKDFIFQYQKGVAAVTKADILQVARQYIHPESFTIVAVGKPSDFGKPLNALGRPVNSIDLSIPRPQRGVKQSDAESMNRGRRLFARVQEAVGGVSKLTSIKDLTLVSTMEISAGSSSMKARKIERWIAPSIIRQDQELPFAKIAAYFDGASGWLSTPQGFGPLQGLVLQQQQGELFRLFFRLWLSDRDKECTVTGFPENILDISDSKGNHVRLQVDESSGLPVTMSYQMPGMPSDVGNIEERFGQWRQVDGIKFPFERHIRQAGGGEITVVVQDIRLNAGLQKEDLKRRP